MAQEQKTLTARRSDSNEQTGSQTVTVASKMPFDFTMRLYKFSTRHEAVLGGGSREVKISEALHNSPVYVINGNSYSERTGPGQKQLSSGYAITHGIPKDFFEQWLDQNKDADYVVNHIIFAHSELQSVYADAADSRTIKSGLERLDPNNLPKNLQTADTRRAS